MLAAPGYHMHQGCYDYAEMVGRTLSCLVAVGRGVHWGCHLEKQTAQARHHRHIAQDSIHTTRSVH